MRLRTLALAMCFVCLCVPLASGQQKRPSKDAEPRVTMTLPLGVAPGKTTKVTVRGVKLDGATAVRFADPKMTFPLKLVGKGKASVPNMMDAARVGDTQVEVEIALPADVSTDVGLVVVTPAGETPPHRLMVETSFPVVAEKEPNPGFRQAQPLQLPAVVEGSINFNQDVDVYRIEGKVGQRITAEVLAARFGSALDGFLTLYDAEGRQIAASDDADGSDPRLEVKLPRDGVYFLSLLDAHDQGGALHPYRLRVSSGP
jgi:hypothetical protein